MNNKAFTLIEVLIAVLLVGVAIASLVGAGIGSTKANAASVVTETERIVVIVEILIEFQIQRRKGVSCVVKSCV